MKEVTKYHNDLNSALLRKWNAEELNFLFAVLTKIKEEGTKEIVFDPEELRALSGDDFNNLKRWEETMNGVAKKITQLNYVKKTTRTIEAMVLFQYFKVELDKKRVEVQVSDKFEYILNDLNANFTLFELDEFIRIKSGYAKALYRLLKQWRSVGKREFSKEDFITFLEIPKDYRESTISTRVLKPCLKELSSFFQGLALEKIKEKRKIVAYRFTWKPEAPAQKGPSVNVPLWHDPEYKNETTEEELEQLKALKEKSKERLDKLGKK